MPDYKIPDDFMNLSNEIYEPLYQSLQRAGQQHVAEKAKAGTQGLMGFFHEHDYNNLQRMGIDGWMGDSLNPDRDAVRRDRIQDIIYDLRNIIDQIIDEHPDLIPDPNDPDDLRLAQSITDMLVRMFGTRAEGIRKSKKSKSKKSKSKKSKSKKSKSKKSKSNKSKSKKNKPNRKKKKTKRKR